MEIESLRVQVKQSAVSSNMYEFHTAVYINSRYLGKQVYEYAQLIGGNDFEGLYSRMMRYAEEEIKKTIFKHHLAKFKKLRVKK